MTVDVGWIGFAALFVFLGAIPGAQLVADVRARHLRAVPIWTLCVLASVYVGGHALLAATR